MWDSFFSWPVVHHRKYIVACFAGIISFLLLFLSAGLPLLFGGGGVFGTSSRKTKRFRKSRLGDSCGTFGGLFAPSGSHCVPGGLPGFRRRYGCCDWVSGDPVCWEMSVDPLACWRECLCSPAPRHTWLFLFCGSQCPFSAATNCSRLIIKHGRAPALPSASQRYEEGPAA